MLSRPIAENALNRLAAVIFPAVLLCISAAALYWQFAQPEAPTGADIAIHAMEQPLDGGALDHEQIGARLHASSASVSVQTHLSSRPYWIALSATAPRPGMPWAVEFPSRHAMELECWDRASDALLGQADRSTVQGQMERSRGGFALALPAGVTTATLLCRSSFRGPAKITASAWDAEALHQAQATHGKVGALIEAGLGMLALSMLLMAIINRSRLYGSFVVWLLLSMRMASLSAGTDFDWLGLPIRTDWLIPLRQWTVCMYSTATVALFGQLFRREIARFRSRRLLNALQFSAVALLAVCPLLSFEQVLPVVWVLTVSGIGIMLLYLYRILRHSYTTVAFWYALSIAVTLLASFNEVVAASFGRHSVLGGLDSVSAALASALFVFAAAAEHMRLGRKKIVEAQQLLKTAYDDSPIGLFTLRDGDSIANSNPAFRAMLKDLDSGTLTRLSLIFGAEVAQALEELRNKPLPAILELQTRVEIPGTDTESWFAIKLLTHDGKVVEGSLQDISEKVRATKRLEFLVNHDPLTECLNLRGLSRQFERSHQQAKALAYFDLDRFKLINDLYGHPAGDAVLRQVCERMRSQLIPGNWLARVGGDEFVVAFTHDSMAAAKQCCENICALISSAPFQIDAQRFTLNVSAGLVATERFGKSPLKEVISAADTLCRIAKKRPTERLVVMESGNRFFQQHKNELELISCLERGETPQGLFLLMQPEISLLNPFDSLNFEVLLRMRKPDGEIVPAPIIIEAAEAHGKTAIIDMWVMRTVIAWLETHAPRLRRTQFVGVNLSGGSLNDESFIEQLFALLAQHPRVVPLLCLEITETVALTDMHHMQRFIDRARAIGAKVSLDDFGAGYSSFGYLKGLSVDALKLDGSLVKDAAQNPATMAILAALGGLAKNLGMKSIGEFAEDLQTIKALVAAGVDYAQGYAISKPVLPERILAARSGADFIEDAEVLEYVKQLQALAETALPLMGEGMDMWGPQLLH